MSSEQSATHYTSGGSTGSDGVVVIQTHGKYAGAPLGKYTVYVTKEEEIKTGPWDQIPAGVSESKTFMEQHKKELKSDIFSVVNQKYATAKTSDLTIEVTKSGVEQTLDVGKPVRDKVSGIIR